MYQKGFTLIEVLTTVVIIGILASLALPTYMRAIERSRATEAMASIKALNDSIYAYFAEHEACPERFSQLVVNLPSGTSDTDTSISGKYFQFDLGGASAAVPGTDDCNGVLATRINGGSYAYTIWNPYTRGNSGDALSLQCAPVDASSEKNIAICESLGLYRRNQE